ncbi:MAG TPA: hypothetical protein VJ793_11260 [Anaerolineae bacterium]|nr:hypothetical protein [Anaerolineae bacterium]
MEDMRLITQTISIVLPIGMLMGLFIGYSLFGGTGSSGQEKEDR